MIPVLFTSEMQKSTTSFSPSATKPQMVINDWTHYFPNGISINSFPPFTKQDLALVHSPAYIDSIFSGLTANGFGVKDSNFAQTFLYTNASLYYAACQALNQGIAVSPTSGFHHAGFDKPEGFCTFNGLIISSMKLHNEGKVNKVGILDFDMHYGNGTQDLIERHQLNYITHYTAGEFYDLHYPALNFIKPLVKKIYHKFFLTNKHDSQGNVSLSTPKPKFRQFILKNRAKNFIKYVPNILEQFYNVDLIIYQAGADQHINDPYGGLLTYEQMLERDRLVFTFAKEKGIPLVWNLAGGYQRDNNGSIDPVLQCHRNTMKVCLDIYNQSI